MRRAYIDWLRGVAVLIMIHAHVIDAWTRPQDKAWPDYEWILRVNGIGAPLFLFLAGVSVALAGSAGVRRHGDPARASWSLQKRGWEIFALAMLFRIQAWLVSPGATLYGILKVDILNVMGPTIAAAAWLWGRGSTDRARFVVLGVATLGVIAVTPWVRATPVIAAWPQPLAWYFQPMPGRFAFFPWSGLLLAGATVGVALAAASTAEAERRVVGWTTAAGAALFVGALTASYFPAVHGRTEFWTTSASFYFARIGVMAVMLGLAHAWMDGRRVPWSPLLQFGRTSLFVYWIHVELAYGVVASPVRGQLPLGWAYLGMALFTLAMLAASLGKDRLVAWWRARRAPVVTAAQGA